MSYQVLARKYRPMAFEEVLGQEHVTQTLQNAVVQNRIAGAYLFCGPRGVGKTTVARLLAKALNCDQGPTPHPCNVCSSCIEVNESRSLDVLEIDGASNRGIDEVRNLRESLRYSPNPGKSRVFIIDEVHMLTEPAFNALLKTLEEPPPRVHFIFATTEPQKVPATIVSRCQRFDFKRIAAGRIIEQLKTLCKREAVAAEEEALRLIAEKADGSMRDAESILDQIIAFAGNTISASAAADLLGVIGLPIMFSTTDLIRAHDRRGMVELVQRIFAEGYDFSAFLNGLTEHLRNLLIVSASGSTDELNVSEEFARRYLESARDFETEDLLRLIKIAAETEALIRRSSNARIHLEAALLKMASMPQSVQLSQLLTQIEEIKKKSREHVVSSTPLKTVPPADSASKSREPRPSESAAAVSFEEVERRWPEVLQHLKRDKVALAAVLAEGWPLRISGPYLEVGFSGRNGFHQASVERNAGDVEAAMAEVIGVKLRLRCVQISDERLQEVRKLAPATDKRQEFLKLQQENELAAELVRRFDLEFVK